MKYFKLSVVFLKNSTNAIECYDLKELQWDSAGVTFQ